MATLDFVLNGRGTSVEYEPGMTLLEVLRACCGVTSAKDGCSGQGVCGCCLVLIDGNPALSCLRRPEKTAGKEVVTLEGLPEEQRRVLAAAFTQEGALQCGFCTPGIAVRAKGLLDRGKGKDADAVRKALAGNLCRCTGYQSIVDAIAAAQDAWSGAPLAGTATRAPFFGESLGLVRAEAPRCEKGVGASVRNYQGPDKVLGCKPYVADLAVAGMAHGAVVLGAYPRALVRAIDTSAALASAGVVAVLTASDVPGDRVVGLIKKDWPVFVAVGEETRCIGDVLALVVAESQFSARAAAAKVVVDCEPRSPVTDPFAALEVGAHAVHPTGNLLETCAYTRGDVDQGLASAAHILTERFQTQRIEHAYLEPEACLALAASDGATIKVFTQGQGVHEDQAQIAAVLGLPLVSVDVELVSNGGAFGGKEDLCVQAQTALAAWKLGRPVQTVLTREQSLLMHPKRHPLSMDYTIGADAEGRLLAARVRITGDTGAYASVGTKVLERAAGHATGPYRVPAVDVEARTVYTNNPPCGAMRGFGVNQTSFAIEGLLDRLAAIIGVDGYEIRARNILRPGDAFATGQILDSGVRGLARSLEAVRDVYRAHRYAGIACGIKNTGIGNGMADIGRVRLRVLTGGRLEILTGYTEMGQGLFTILRQVVAEETGLDPDVMSVRAVSDLAVVCGMTTASRATALATKAAQEAALQLAASLRERPICELVGECFDGEYICDFTVKPGKGGANPITHLTFSYAAQVVVLDERGALERVVAAHDVGRAINPLQCAGQIEGGVHMGLGYALSEDFPCTGGVPDSLQLLDLGIIKAQHTPRIDVVLIEEPDAVGGYGAKGVGEIGLVPTAGAVAGALHAFDGKWRTRLPMADAAAAAALVPKSRRR
ncbi:MAG: selenium-dependent xanthine dehydrogenase [Candidatus Schekmanbacteria bacterium]|nr:selenium-dependent xanthine dehydrogenase [Candidatus Schekmanbacteria bacterium]